MFGHDLICFFFNNNLIFVEMTKFHKYVTRSFFLNKLKINRELEATLEKHKWRVEVDPTSVGVKKVQPFTSLHDRWLRLNSMAAIEKPTREQLVHVNMPTAAIPLSLS